MNSQAVVCVVYGGDFAGEQSVIIDTGTGCAACNVYGGAQWLLVGEFQTKGRVFEYLLAFEGHRVDKLALLHRSAASLNMDSKVHRDSMIRGTQLGCVRLRMERQASAKHEHRYSAAVILR